MRTVTIAELAEEAGGPLSVVERLVAIAAGIVVVRDGDVYGQTVNLAARIAGEAGPGQVVVEEGAVIALPAGTAQFEPLGRVKLKGIPDDVGLWLATSVAMAP